MRYWLVGSVLLVLPCVALAQEKSCPVEQTYVVMLKQARDAAERRAAELAVQVQQLVKDRQVLEKQLADMKKQAE